MGKLVTRTATKASRTPHAPASCAPCTGFYLVSTSAYNIVGIDIIRGIWNTYDKNEDALETGADKDEDTCTEHNAGCDLLDRPQCRAPQHGQGNQDQIDVGNNVGGERDPDNRLGYRRLACI